MWKLLVGPSGSPDTQIMVRWTNGTKSSSSSGSAQLQILVPQAFHTGKSQDFLLLRDDASSAMVHCGTAVAHFYAWLSQTPLLSGLPKCIDMSNCVHVCVWVACLVLILSTRMELRDSPFTRPLCLSIGFAGVAGGKCVKGGFVA